MGSATAWPYSGKVSGRVNPRVMDEVALARTLGVEDHPVQTPCPVREPIHGFSEQVIQALLECLQGRECFASGGSMILFSRKLLFMMD